MCVSLPFSSCRLLFINRCHYIPIKVLTNLFITLWNQVCVFSLYFIKDESSTESSWFIWVIMTIISHLSAQKCLCDAPWLFIWFLLWANSLLAWPYRVILVSISALTFPPVTSEMAGLDRALNLPFIWEPSEFIQSLVEYLWWARVDVKAASKPVYEHLF